MLINNKRVIEFYAMIDAIPADATFISSTVLNVRLPLTKEEVTKKLISGDEEPKIIPITKCFYEVPEETFQTLLRGGFFSVPIEDKAHKLNVEIRKYANSKS